MCTFAPLLLFKHTNPIIDQWQQHSKVTVGEKDHLYPVSFNCVTSLSPSLSVPKECQVIMLIFLTGFSDFFWLFPKHQYNSFYMSFLNSICSIILDLQCVWCRVSWRKNKLKELSRVKVEVSMLDVISGLMDSAAANHQVTWQRTQELLLNAERWHAPLWHSFVISVVTRAMFSRALPAAHSRSFHGNR